MPYILSHAVPQSVLEFFSRQAMNTCLNVKAELDGGACGPPSDKGDLPGKEDQNPGGSYSNPDRGNTLVRNLLIHLPKMWGGVPLRGRKQPLIGCGHGCLQPISWKGKCRAFSTLMYPWGRGHCWVVSGCTAEREIKNWLECTWHGLSNLKNRKGGQMELCFLLAPSQARAIGPLCPATFSMGNCCSSVGSCFILNYDNRKEAEGLSLKESLWTFL